MLLWLKTNNQVVVLYINSLIKSASFVIGLSLGLSQYKLIKNYCNVIIYQYRAALQLQFYSLK